jgi:hypothetical protein
MQDPPTPTEDDEASIPTEHVRNGPNLNRTFTVRRKAAKRILPWDLPIDEIQLALPRPQDEDIQERKRPRLEEPVPTSTDDAIAENTSHNTALALPPPDRDESNPVGGMHPNRMTAGVHWTPEEDAKLTSAVAKTKKKCLVMEHRIDWVAIAALVPRRTNLQCQSRWYNALNPSIDQTSGRTGKWKEDEDIKLKAAVQTDGGKNWAAIAELVPGRTKIQCRNRWRNVLDPSITLTAGRADKWTEDEDLKLKNSVQTRGGKSWDEIAALVQGRTRKQCFNRWRNTLDPSIALTTGRTGKWTEDEDIKLKNSVHMHGGKGWKAIAALVQGRTKIQCCNRWHDLLDPSIDLTAGRKGKWARDEDIKLKAAVQTHGGKSWDEIAALVQGRTRKQCFNRWHYVLDPAKSR